MIIFNPLLRKVKKDYTQIAQDFSDTRSRPWPEFSVFLKLMKPPVKLLDIGCGNGRLYDFFARSDQAEQIFYTGIDNNPALIKIAKKKHPDADFRIADALALPFPPKSFDSVWCIAVLHHLPASELRLKALKEMRRVLKKNGTLMLAVWNLRQPKYKKYIDKNSDALIPWKNKIERYYHAFTRAELMTQVRKTGFKKIKNVKSAWNFCFAAT